MDRIRCAACDDLFTPRRNIPDQRFCSKAHCQRERRRRWQRQKLKSDPDYRANQAVAQRRWRERNPDYWTRYRRSHPAYAERNRRRINGVSAAGQGREFLRVRTPLRQGRPATGKRTLDWRE